MLAFGVRYIQTRDAHIGPLTNLKVMEDKLPYRNLKYSLGTYPKYMVQTGSDYEFTFNKDDLYMALIGDFEYFYTRMLTQYGNLVKISNETSRCWSFVTFYYLSFFSITTLLRLFHTGCTYLNSDEAKNISNYVSAVTGQMYRINSGNYKFSVKPSTSASGDLILFLEQINARGKGTHEITWELVTQVLRNMLFLSNSKDDEGAILSSLLHISSTLKPNFLSAIRNQINYQAKYGLESMKESLQKISFAYSSDELYKALTNYNGEKDEKAQFDIAQAYSYFLFVLCNKLYNEYTQRSNSESLHNHRRNLYIDKHGITLPDFKIYT